jgi:calcium-dependent protein kinase
VNLKATAEELEELKAMFFKLDTSKDGKLTIEEIKDGMENIQGIFKGNKSEYQQMMWALDKDGNGVIDYQEFITAAIDKAALLNKKNLIAAFKMLD